MLRNITKTLFGLVLAAIVSFGSIIGPAIAGEAEDNFVKTLVAGSPWKVSWDAITVRGTQEMSFSVEKEGKVVGKIFNLSFGKADSALKNITIMKNGVKFVVVNTGTVFEYHLNPDGTMGGKLEGATNTGNPFRATVQATPASGAKK